MSAAYDIAQVLEEYQASSSLREILPKAVELLPDGHSFTDDVWNILPWIKRKGNAREFNIDFSDFSNKELKKLTKVFLLYKRLTGNIGKSLAYNTVYANMSLDKIIWQKNIHDINNADFYRAEESLKSMESPARLCHHLLNFGEWLNARIGIPISYVPTVKEIYKHGRYASEEGREKKLVGTDVVRDMIEANKRNDLSNRDRFFLSALTILFATGFRINELATLPKNCLEERDGDYSLRYFAEKVRRLEARYIAKDIVPAVQAAINHIIEITELGREAVRGLRALSSFDWSAILQDQQATEYFVGKFAHEWTSDPNHQLINPHGAWLNKEQRYIDIISIVDRTGSKSAAARELSVTRATVDGLLVAQQNARQGLLPNVIATRGTDSRSSWDTDSRVISLLKFIDYCGIFLHKDKRERCRPIIDAAQALQLQGKVYPSPPSNPGLEVKFGRVVRPVVIDGNGKSILEPEDALFVIPRYFLSEAKDTKHDDYRLITDREIGRWLAGEGRSRGTGNHEDSCFVRLNIIDPKTGTYAKFTSHDIRHWLNTIYAEGHVDEDTIALIFSRKKQSNHVYDQTSKKTRLENIRKAVREGKAMGHVSENYSRLAEYSREDAERYLIANTLMVNLMPHGACTLSWGMKACPNHLSCFAGDDGSGPCSFFYVDNNDSGQMSEVKRIDDELTATLNNMSDISPQFAHLRNIKNNIENLLKISEVSDGSC